jgi:CRP/FNR family transcriptional regulator
MSVQIFTERAAVKSMRSPSAAGRPTTALDEMDARALERIGTRITVPRDHTIFFEEDPANTIYQVVSGALRTSRVMADGRRYVVDFLFPGDFAGLNDGSTRKMTTETLCETVLIRYSRREFETALDANRRLGRMILSVLHGGLACAHDRLFLLGRKTAVERLATFLLTMAARKGGDRLELPMNREDIADHLGLTTETISRTFSRLKAKGLIRTSGSATVMIQSRDALEDLAERC